MNQRSLLPVRIWKALTKERGASTLFRLGRSQLVADLQLIFFVTLVLMLAGSLFVIAGHTLLKNSGVIGPTPLITGIVGVGAGVLAWTYQKGSVRLGVVDLFACEITTICRVITIVDAASHYVQAYHDPPEVSKKFRSEEQYAPVFDQHCGDLEALEARIIVNVTEFYTYLKTMRDYIRVLGDIERPKDEAESWRAGVRDVIYMLFLMLESARKSVEQLVEYEPEQIQNTITILLSELVAFGLLLDAFEEEARVHPTYDAKLERLRLRREYYQVMVPEICDHVNIEKDKKNIDTESWKRAAALTGELSQRYRDVFERHGSKPAA